MSNLQVSDDCRVLTIYGIRYAIELFEHLGIAPIGSRIEIVSREDGVVTLRKLPAVSKAELDAIRQRDADCLTYNDGSIQSGEGGDLVAKDRRVLLAML